ncbi:MAG: protein-(glutamine-N5) methyltransferase, release factor-specific [Parcubacteria group bacterium]|nr:protein-(glutamine-N5) methyltransferase, release factor-specific [Parcubacteria group bacterium]|tara:strand:+ start:6173 stop:7018 length:846 start_codon:yes stop_codon:yes gene_type:complete
MTIHQALTWATQKLKSKRIKTASLDTEVLLSYVLKKPKEFLFTYPEKKLTKAQINKFNSLVKRRLKNEPVAYLTNNKEFYGLNFYVNNQVLIPGPDTEILIDEAVRLVTNKKITIADIGTGSGAIAITLAKHLPAAQIYATDISKPALTVARKNAKLHNTNIKFYNSDLLSPIKNKKIDIIIANLPYGDNKLWSKRKTQQALEIKHEPAIALYSKNAGLEIFHKFFKQISELKFLPTYILIEIDHTQTKVVPKIIKKYLANTSIKIKKDLAGLNRLVIVKL